MSEGLDFYDGSNVPAITEISGGRFLMAAWIPIHGWGGNLILRELLQFPEGRVGSKWMEEVVPKTRESRMLEERLPGTKTFETGGKSFLLTFDVVPGKTTDGKFAVLFMREGGEKDACEFQLCLRENRAQFAPGVKEEFSKKEKTLREGGAPQQARDYAVENLIGSDKKFAVRLVVKGCDKIGGSLIDAEIAGARTMITFRPELTVGKFLFKNESVSIENLKIAALDGR